MSASPKNPPAPGRRRRSSGLVVPHEPRWYQRIGAWLVFAAIRTVAATLRYRWQDNEGVFQGKPPGPVIYSIWHNRLVLSMIAYHGFVRPRNPTAGLAAMVSASRDGGFLTSVLERFKVQPVRGSSSRRGPQALLELTTWAERGYDLGITPDGPRGPCYSVQDGVMALAQVTGLPIVPFSYHLQWKIQVASWDRFQIPLPFSRCTMSVGQPIFVPRETSDADREQLRSQLERALKQISID